MIDKNWTGFKLLSQNEIIVQTIDSSLLQTSLWTQRSIQGIPDQDAKNEQRHEGQLWVMQKPDTHSHDINGRVSAAAFAHHIINVIKKYAWILHATFLQNLITQTY